MFYKLSIGKRCPLKILTVQEEVLLRTTNFIQIFELCVETRVCNQNVVVAAGAKSFV